MKKKKKTKYSLGTGKNGVVRHYIESPSETLAENDIAMAKAKQKAMNNGWGQGLDILGGMALNYGTSMMTSNIGVGEEAAFGGLIDTNKMNNFADKNAGGLASTLNMLPMFAELMAMGGKVKGVPVEVEGKEVGETPDGQIIDFKGPSHENGGIDINLPEGTEIFSKRIKVGGKTMAERKLAREKKTNTLEKLLGKSENDIVLKNSLKRTKINNSKEEEKDQKLQDMISNMKQLTEFAYGTGKEGVQSFDGGGTVMGNLLRNIFGGNKKDYKDGLLNFSDLKFDSDNASNSSGTADTTLTQGVNDFTYGDTMSFAEGNNKPSLPGENGNIPNFSLGDITGLAGTLYSAFAPMSNTQANRAGDTPNINAFEDFGNDALDRIDDAKGYIGSQKDEALKDLETSRTRTTQNNRKSARGVNTMRALDLATDVNANNAQADIYDNFSKQMMQLLGTQAGFENQQDSAVMQGEQNRDLADRQDRDNYFSQMAEDISTKGQGIQQIGKMLNENKSNTAAEKAVNDSSVNFKYTNGVLTDKAGNTVMSQAEIAKAAKTIGVTVEEYINMINK